VISLISVLAGIAMANYRNAVLSAQEAVLKENLFSACADAIDQYYADKGQVPGGARDAGERGLPAAGFPRTRSRDRPRPGRAVPAEPDLTDPKRGAGSLRR